MHYSLSCESTKNSPTLFTPDALPEEIAKLPPGAHATIRAVEDEDVWTVWSVSRSGDVKHICDFDDEDDAVRCSQENESSGVHCLVVPKSIGKPAFKKVKA